MGRHRRGGRAGSAAAAAPHAGKSLTARTLRRSRGDYGMRVGDMCQARRCACASVRHTRITMGEVAAKNRRARFPAAQKVGVLRIASAPDLARPPHTSPAKIPRNRPAPLSVGSARLVRRDLESRDSRSFSTRCPREQERDARCQRPAGAGRQCLAIEFVSARLVHLHVAGADAAAEVVELHVGMIRQQRHRHGRVGHTLRDHQRGQPLAERVVVRGRHARWTPSPPSMFPPARR